MTAETFKQHQLIELSAEFTDLDDNPVDPDAVTFTMKQPDGSPPTIYRSGSDAQLIHDRTGRYYVLWRTTMQGRHDWGMESTGAGEGANDAFFTVLASRII